MKDAVNETRKLMNKIAPINESNTMAIKITLPCHVIADDYHVFDQLQQLFRTVGHLYFEEVENVPPGKYVAVFDSKKIDLSLLSNWKHLPKMQRLVGGQH